MQAQVGYRSKNMCESRASCLLSSDSVLSPLGDDAYSSLVGRIAAAGEMGKWSLVTGTAPRTGPRALCKPVKPPGLCVTCWQIGLLGITALCTTCDAATMELAKTALSTMAPSGSSPNFPQSILGNKYKGLYNVSGRGIPDISAQAFGFQIFVGGKEKEVYGTSGSTHLCVSWVVRPRAPDVLQVVAGIILNDFQFSDNRYTLCFFNPWLYGPAARLLDDIQNRTNPGCNIDGFCRRMGSYDRVFTKKGAVWTQPDARVTESLPCTGARATSPQLKIPACPENLKILSKPDGPRKRDEPYSTVQCNGQNVGFPLHQYFPLLTPSSSVRIAIASRRKAKGFGFNRINDSLPHDLKTRRPRQCHAFITDTDYHAKSLREQNLTQIPNGTHVYSAVVDVDQLDSMGLVTENT
ncbi:hypothetical protein EDB84DRAFT_1436073 [Lactarius hengduanensis]|nr:hypothetical protein EDB84DRAFT_1436073 [Lactarius hengduanensis]